MRFQRCSVCEKQQFARVNSGVFCSKACFAKAWPRHKSWHKEQKDLQLSYKLHFEGRQPPCNDSEYDSEYDRLNKKANALMFGGDLKGSAKLLQKAIKLEPSSGYAYYNLGRVRSMSNDRAGAAKLLLLSAECEPVGSSAWGFSIAHAFNKLLVVSRNRIAEIEFPTWWNDEALLTLSAQVIAADVSYVTWTMRSAVLSAAGEWPGVHQRSIEEWKEATRCAFRAYKLGESEREKHEGLRNAMSMVNMCIKDPATETLDVTAGSCPELVELVNIATRLNHAVDSGETTRELDILRNPTSQALVGRAIARRCPPSSPHCVARDVRERQDELHRLFGSTRS